MINEQENKTSLKAMSDLEYAKNDTEMMRYRVNGLSNRLGLAAMVFSLFAAFICLNSFQPANFQTIVIILMNIVILLGGFLCAEKSKNYVKAGAIGQIVFGAICFARIFYIPLILIIKYNQYTAAIAAGDSITKANIEDNWLGKPITAQFGGDTARANRILPGDGNFRGVLAIILLVCAGALFITAGVIGYIRSKKLATYLSSLKEKK